MRIVLTIGLVVALAGCESIAIGQNARARHVGDDVCLPASSTAGATPPGAAAGCRSLDGDAPGWQQAWDLHLCGPCNFAYDATTTARERASGHGTDCCYVATSPPPPTPPS